MSIESAKAFIERMKTDEDFAKAVTNCKDSESRKELVFASGFNFTMDELSQLTGKEISQEVLEQVVGGQILCDSGCRYKE